MEYAALIISLIKILLDLSIFLVKRINQYERQKQSKDGKPCLSLVKGSEKDECTNLLFKRKCKNGICPREKCAGFTTEFFSEEKTIPLFTSPVFLTIKKIVDVFPELAAALLALSIINQ